MDSPEASRSSRATTQSWTLSTVTDRGFPAPHQERQDPLRIVFAGTPTAAVPSLAALLESAHEIAAVITRPAARRGRGRSINASPIADLASAAGIELLTPDTPKDKQFQDRLAELDPDAAVVVAYGALLPPPVLAIPRHGWINLHFSLLPRWRGAAPVQHALIAGDAETGAAVFQLVPELAFDLLHIGLQQLLYLARQSFDQTFSHARGPYEDIGCCDLSSVQTSGNNPAAIIRSIPLNGGIVRNPAVVDRT